MAARVFLLSILFTEVLRPACLAGVKGTSDEGGGVRVSSRSETSELERSGGLSVAAATEPSGNVDVGRREAVSRLRGVRALRPCATARCSLKRDGESRFRKMVQKSGRRGSKSNGNDTAPSRELYRCVAKNNVGSLGSSPAHAQTANMSREFNKSPQDVSIYEGEVARLSCFIDSIPSPPSIAWQRDRQPLSFVNRTNYFTVSPGVLYINATKLSDAGSYRCVATNKPLKKARRSKEAKLRVVSKLEERKTDVPTLLFPQTSYDYQLAIGSDLTLVCASSGFPSLVTWTFTSQARDGAAFEQPHPLSNSIGNFAVLELNNVTPADAGVYECSMENFGTIQQTQSISVDVHVPPTFLKKPANQTFFNGRNARFECQAQGHPTPQIHWLKDSRKLEMNPRRGMYRKENNRVELAISATIPEDSGIYQCVAVNAAGEICAASRLQVTPSPRSPPIPTSLKCRAVSSEKILLSWEPPKTGLSHNTDAYITVHYTSMEPGSRETILLPDQNSSSIEIKPLEPFTNYTMYVRMWVGKEGSNQSTSVQCSTAASVPIAAPAVTVEPISNTKLNVSWLPLNKREARGYVVEYKLQWRLLNWHSSRVRDLPPALNRYILRDLIPGARYKVRVLARTQQGWPNSSDSQFNWTDVIMPSTDSIQSPLAGLVDLDVINVNASTVKVEWRINGETTKLEKNFDSWQLYYQNEAGKKLLTYFLPKNCTEYLFKEFVADVSYGIGLCMISSGKPDVCLSRHVHSKRLVDDHALADLEGVPASSTSINITWSAVPSNAAHCYEVCYKAVYSVGSQPPECLNTTDAMVAIGGLRPYTLYQFKVRALHNTSNQGGSPYSEVIECYTEEDVPGPVREVNWFPANFPEGRVTWRQPGRSNGVIRNYTVSYINVPSSTSSKQWTNVTVPASKTTVNLPGLAPSTRYLVEVRAATNAGYGKASDSITIDTGDAPKNSSDHLQGRSPPLGPITDESLGIIVGVSIGTCCIIICLSSIYCRKRWENTLSSRESPQSLKDRVILRNGNGCCLERNSVSAGQHAATATVTNEIELAILCPASPKTTTLHVDTKDGRSNGIVESRVREPLLTSWDVNGGGKDLIITENPQCKPRSSTGSNQRLKQGLDGTQVTTLDYTLTGSDSSVDNNFQRTESLSSLQRTPSTSVPAIGPNGYAPRRNVRLRLNGRMSASNDVR